MTRRSALILALLTCGCSRTSEERKARYVETVQRELAAAAPSYELFSRLKQGLGTLGQVPECRLDQKFPALRLSMAHLELLNGAPHTNGVLVVDLPCPDGFDNVRGFPPKHVEPADVSDEALSKLVKELRAANEALKTTDGFVVQRIDSFVPGTIIGRVAVFDERGVPQCQVAYEATGVSDAGVVAARDEFDKQLRAEFRRFGIP